MHHRGKASPPPTTPHSPHQSTAAKPSSRPAGPARWGLLVLLCLAQLMVILDISAVNIALPDLSRDLRIGPDDFSWTITSYSLVFGSLLLLGGRAADLLGRRRVFLSGLGVFTAASLGSALAGGAAALFAARAGQGMGAAMLSPAALSIITVEFTGRDRARALGVWGAIGGAGAAIGVLLGGALTQLIDWRAIFLINLPIGLIVAVIAAQRLPADQARPRWRGLDLPGALLATAGVGALVLALSQAESSGWTSAQTVGLLLAGLAAVTAFALIERRVSLPLLEVQRLADRAIGGGFALMLAAAAILFGSFLLSSMYLQRVIGAGTLATGLGFLPLALAIGAGVHGGTRIVAQRGVRVPLVGGFAVVAVGMFLLSGVSPRGSYLGDLLPGMLTAGIGMGVVLVSVAFSVLSGAQPNETGMLSGLNTTGHEVGGSIGIAALATIATGGLAPGHAGAATLAVSSGIGDAYLAAAIIAVAASLCALAVLPTARRFLPRLELAPPATIH